MMWVVEMRKVIKLLIVVNKFINLPYRLQVILMILGVTYENQSSVSYDLDLLIQTNYSHLLIFESFRK
jgi:hypothetical protein